MAIINSTIAGGGGGIQGSVIQALASENITAGSFVDFESVIGIATITNANIACKLSENKVLMYGYNESNYPTVVVAVVNDDDTITMGTPVVVYGAAYKITSFTVLTQNKVMVVFGDNGYHKELTIDGMSIVVGNLIGSPKFNYLIPFVQTLEITLSKPKFCPLVNGDILVVGYADYYLYTAIRKVSEDGSITYTNIYRTDYAINGNKYVPKPCNHFIQLEDNSFIIAIDGSVGGNYSALLHIYVSETNSVIFNWLSYQAPITYGYMPDNFTTMLVKGQKLYVVFSKALLIYQINGSGSSITINYVDEVNLIASSDYTKQNAVGCLSNNAVVVVMETKSPIVYIDSYKNMYFQSGTIDWDASTSSSLSLVEIGSGRILVVRSGQGNILRVSAKLSATDDSLAGGIAKTSALAGETVSVYVNQ